MIGSELARSKPDPLPYLTALELTGASAANAVAFEDSLSGVRAAVCRGRRRGGDHDGASGRTAGRRRRGVRRGADFHDPRIYELMEKRRGRDGNTSA